MLRLSRWKLAFLAVLVGLSNADAGGLSLEQATKRAALVDSAGIAYRLSFDLDEQGDEFRGETTLDFVLRPDLAPGEELLVDFTGGKLSSLSVNCPGEQCLQQSSKDAEARRREHWIVFQVSELLPGQRNRIAIAYTHRYADGGNALTRVTDSADKSVYAYTNLEPYYANQVFPCFDQPDLKASFTVEVNTPAHWKVVSNAALQGSAPASDGKRKHVFLPTQRISTYLFAMAAGPFHVWESEASVKDASHGVPVRVPLRLLAPRAFAKFVDAKQWLQTTREGLAFYSHEFDVVYPFSKLDQVLVPGLSFGGMENPGAIFYNVDDVTYRGITYVSTYVSNAKIILHEISHQWFGDLVTMKWWDDLWLNESFAVFMASEALSRLPKLQYSEHSWIDNLTGSKTAAYQEDAKTTSHPILAVIRDTDDADANFDGLTYGKGAAALRQLRLQIGSEGFRKGLHDYFLKYRFSNATFNDLIDTFAPYAKGLDLDAWRSSWLASTGFNRVSIDYDCQGGSLSELRVRQAPGNGSQILRAHRTRLGFYYWNAGKTRLAPKYMDVAYSGPVTIQALKTRMRCPVFVLPNVDAADYVDIELDGERGLPFVAEHLTEFPDPVTRQLLWLLLWERTADGKSDPRSYTQLALRSLPREQNVYVLGSLLVKLTTISPSRPSLLRYLRGAEREQFLSSMEPLVRQGLMQAWPGTPQQLILWAAYRNTIRSFGERSFVKALLAGKAHVPGLKLTQDRRWEAIQGLARSAEAKDKGEMLQLIGNELKRDPTGKSWAYAAEQRIPDTELRQQWFRWIMKIESAAPRYTDADLSDATWSFHTIGQEDVSRSFAQPFFDAILKLLKKPDAERPDPTYLENVATNLYPAICDPEVNAQGKDFLSQHRGELPPIVHTNLQRTIEEDERCIRVLEVYP
jgi:aminopeptidase N